MSSAYNVANQLNNTVDALTNSINTHVSRVRNDSGTLKNSTLNALEEIIEFTKKMIRNEQMQAAHERVLCIDQEIREKFSSNIRVRKTVMGVVGDFDIDLCRASTIDDLSQELWITSSRYWLSFALIALSAWVNDSKSLANNAVNEAVRVNPLKSSLFFCLVNLRFGRLEAAKKWLTSYFNSVEPDEMKDETSILLQSYINGVFGQDKTLEFKVQTIVDQWIRGINMDENLSAELVSDYEGYIEKLGGAPNFSCSTLSKICPDAEALRRPYVESFKYKKLIDLVESLNVDNVDINPANYKEVIDEIIKDLITNFDEEEQEVKNKRDYYQLIIDNSGDVETAEAQYNERMELRNRTMNFGRKLVEWSLYSEVDIHVRKFALQNAKEWFLTALEKWSASFEDNFPKEFHIQLDDWSCVSNGDDQCEQELNYKEHLEKNKNKVMYFNSTNKSLFVWLLIFIAGGLGLTLFAVPREIIPQWGNYVGYGLYGLAALFAVIIIVRCATAGSKFRKMVAEKVAILSSAMVELTEIRKKYFENIQGKTTLFNLTERL